MAYGQYLSRANKNQYDETCAAFVKREPCTGSTRLFVSEDARRLYSYGRHYVLARWDEMGGETLLVNRTWVSAVTHRQKRELLSALAARPSIGWREVESLDETTPVRDLIHHTLRVIDKEIGELVASWSRATSTTSIAWYRYEMQRLMTERYNLARLVDVDVTSDPEVEVKAHLGETAWARFCARELKARMLGR